MLKNILLAGVLLFSLAQNGRSAIISAWDFSTQTGGVNNFGVSPLSPTTADVNITATALTRGAGISTTGTGAVNAWGGTGFITTSPNLANAIAADEFITFSVSANAGFELSLSSIDAYNIRRSGSGPTTGQWQYSLGGGSFNDIGSAITWGTTTTSAGNNQAAISLSGISELQGVDSGISVLFRVVTWGATNSGGTWYLNDPADTAATDFGVSGTITAVPEPTSMVLVGLMGVAGVAVRARRRLAKKA